MRGCHAALGALLLGGLAAPPALVAQSRDSVVIDDLRTPASPAFVLLGVAPSSVERPTSPRALAVSLLSASGGDDLLPKSYALEVAPFWLTSHPTLTFDGYYHPGFGRGVLQTLSLSLATTPLASDNDTTSGTALGFGARTFVVAGRPHPDLAGRVKELTEIQGAANRALTAIRNPAERQRTLDSLDAKAKTVALEIQRLDTERVGWIVEAALATTFAFPRDRADSGEVGQFGGWLTLAYRVPDPALGLIAVARYHRDRRVAPSRNLVDLGFRFAWELQDLTVSFEYLERLGDRTITGEQPGYRAAGNLEYQVGSIFLFATLGTDDDGTGRPRLLSTIGLDLGFGKIPLHP